MIHKLLHSRSQNILVIEDQVSHFIVGRANTVACIQGKNKIGNRRSLVIIK